MMAICILNFTLRFTMTKICNRNITTSNCLPSFAQTGNTSKALSQMQSMLLKLFNSCKTTELKLL